MATATGKRMRKLKGLTRHQLHKSSHARKRTGKSFDNNKRRFLKHES